MKKIVLHMMPTRMTARAGVGGVSDAGSGGLSPKLAFTHSDFVAGGLQG